MMLISYNNKRGTLCHVEGESHTRMRHCEKGDLDDKDNIGCESSDILEG